MIARSDLQRATTTIDGAAGGAAPFNGEAKHGNRRGFGPGAFRRLALAAAVIALAACEPSEDRAQEHLERARALAAAEPAKAALEYKNALRLDASLVDARYEYAQLLLGQRSFGLALQELDAVSKQAPGRMDALLSSAEIMLLGGAADEALAKAEAALGIDPANAQALALKATAAHRLGDAGAARRAAEAALLISPDLVTAILTLTAVEFDAGDTEAALARIEAALTRKPDDSSLSLVRLRLLQTIGDIDAMTAQLRALIEQFPEEHAFTLMLARSTVAKGDESAAIDILRQAATASPGESRYALALVETIRQSLGEEKALAELGGLLAASPDKSDLIVAMAVAEHRAGAEADAIARLRAAVDAFAGDAEKRAKLQTAIASLLVLGGDLGAAEAELNDILARNPNAADALTLRGRVKLEAGASEPALADLNKATTLRRSDAQTLLLLSAANARVGNGATSIDNLGEAAIVSDYAPDIVGRYVAALLRNGRADAAESILGAAFAARGDQAGLLAALGQVRLTRGDWGGAARAAEALRATADTAAAALTADGIIAMALSGQGRIEEGAATLESGMESAGETNMRTAALLVDHYMAAGDLDRAYAFVDKLLAQRPKDSALRMMRARLDAARGAGEDAAETLAGVLADEPNNAEAAMALVQTLVALDRKPEAVEAARRAAPDLLAQSPDLRFVLAITLSELGERAEAIAEYEALLAQFPGSAATANNLANVLVEDGATEAERARALQLARGLRNDGVAAFRETYGWVLHRTGDTEGAVRVLDAVSEELSGSAYAALRRAIVYADAGLTAKARETFTAASTLARAQNDEALAHDAEARLGALVGQ